MIYSEADPCAALQPYIHSYWKLKGDMQDSQWERIFPDGRPGIVINLGDDCITDNGQTVMEHGKTYAVGAMTSFKESFIGSDTNLLGVCLKPGTFSSLYTFAPQKELTNATVEFDRRLSFDTSRIMKEGEGYLNRFFTGRMGDRDLNLQHILDDISACRGNLNIRELASRNCTTVRQLERNFATHIGLTPKEYSSIIRLQNTMAQLEKSKAASLSEIAFDCGYYDHAHLANEIKKFTGLTPTQL
ncbi:helix-turn-helix domain-containing protein [Flavobacterium sp. WW92]|uniref:AraC family transcriptional regulator n=1 Tax=unclassified Flavobacterium TaxID=196869 RepID=UPI0022241C9D|nr:MULTISPECIES: helix-turn-helix domain-containing protein [unclassified Flavobacterium]WDO12361.1 helix-turn-helix domain-containing protein [Flavobacterium sp. WW92]